MSTTSTPPDEGKPEDVAISPDEGRPSDTIKTPRKRRPRNTTKTVKKGKPSEVSTSSDAEPSGEVVTPPEVANPPEDPSGEVVILAEAVILGEVVIPSEEGESPEVTTSPEEPSGEVVVLAEEVILGEVVTPPEEGKSPEVATSPEEEPSEEVVTPPKEETPPAVAIPPEEATLPDAEKILDKETPPDTEMQSVEVKPRDAAYWAQQVSVLRVSHVPTGALNLNVEGKQAVGPLQGFGQMWQKTFRIRLKHASVQPTEVIKTWKEHFPKFWPPKTRFYKSLAGIAPGEVALINATVPGGVPLSTGVVVLYADEESFTLMTPQGHTFAGWITFSSYEEDDNTVAQIQALVRANDLIYETGFRLGAAKAEDAIWRHTLTTLAAEFGVVESEIEAVIVCLDPKVQWSRFWNIWHNAGVRTVFYRMLAPVRWLFKRRSR